MNVCHVIEGDELQIVFMCVCVWKRCDSLILSFAWWCTLRIVLYFQCDMTTCQIGYVFNFMCNWSNAQKVAIDRDNAKIFPIVSKHSTQLAYFWSLKINFLHIFWQRWKTIQNICSCFSSNFISVMFKNMKLKKISGKKRFAYFLSISSFGSF